MAKGIDYTFQTTPELAQVFAGEGIEFVCRYLVPKRYEWKRLTKEGAEVLSNAGLNIVSVYETSAGYMKGGAAQAKIDAVEVRQELDTIGQPPGTVVYFTADFDVESKYDMDCLERYLRQMDAELDGYGVGFYGEYDAVEEIEKRGACNYYWQTYAWSRGKLSEHANIYQYHNGAKVAGMTVDLNKSFGNEGWWSLREPGPFPDVAKGRWSEGAIRKISKAGIMTGYPDGTFRPGQAVTREELAAALAAVLGKVK